jgi:hypothetical protein
MAGAFEEATRGDDYDIDATMAKIKTFIQQYADSNPVCC